MASFDHRLLGQAIHSLNDLFYVFSPDGEPLFWNDRVREVTGFSDDELAEMSPTDFFPPPHQERIAASVRRALEEGGSTVEADIVTKDGDRIPHEFTGERLTDPDGDLIGFTGIGRDITERRERQRRLEEQTRQFRGVLDSVEAAIWIRDPESRFQLFNQNGRDLFGIDPECAIEGEHPSAVLPEAVAEQFVENDRRAVEQGEAVEFEETVETAEGTQTFLTRITPLYDDDELFATCGVATDITDLKRTQRELERVNERLDEFVSFLSHDLRNPLAVASGRLELARETGDDDHLAAVERAHDRMDALLEDMLTLAREGERVSAMESVALGSLVEASWEVVETAEATLDVETDRTVRADASRLQQLLENLVRNAVDHGGDNVTVTVGDLDGGFYVEDDGPGIPAEDREAVFESGYTTTAAGLGFGLNIVKQIVDAHGWTIRVREGSDGGARFEITGVDVAGW